jgi:hypothetical protein
MNSLKNSGGAAFPQFAKDPWGNTSTRNEGMTLRDYFAAVALGGIEASQGNSGNFISTVEKVAARAYELADAMLAAREAA